jgi:hypothetical protein
LEWKLYNLIGAEYDVSDGLRYRVYDGTPDTVPMAPPNAIYRFAATPSGLQPWITTETPVAVRVVAPDGTIVHCRAFIPSPYTRTASIKVLRKADGTGTVVFLHGIQPGAGLTPTYQLHLTFRRNNRAVDPSSVILTESGLSDDEVVTIDIPWATH